jgi:YbaB/EbfC DNA-binding family protein
MIGSQQGSQQSSQQDAQRGTQHGARQDPRQATQRGPSGAELSDWALHLKERANRFSELHTRMNALSVTEESPDGTVRVTVDGDGLPTDLALTEASRGVDPARLSASLMACLHRAQATLRHRITDTIRAVVGEDQVGDRIAAQYSEKFPDPPEPSAEARSRTAPEPHVAAKVRQMPIGRIDED